jgi:predicted thioesterase
MSCPFLLHRQLRTPVDLLVELLQVVEHRLVAHGSSFATLLRVAGPSQGRLKPRLRVLATPMLVSYFELAAHQLAMRALEPGQGTVGSRVDIRHLAATPIGMRVTFRATLAERDRRRLLFRVEADDEQERVGEGTHERFVVDIGRFMARIAAKQG